MNKNSLSNELHPVPGKNVLPTVMGILTHLAEHVAKAESRSLIAVDIIKDEGSGENSGPPKEEVIEREMEMVELTIDGIDLAKSSASEQKKALATFFKGVDNLPDNNEQNNTSYLLGMAIREVQDVLTRVAIEGTSAYDEVANIFSGNIGEVEISVILAPDGSKQKLDMTLTGDQLGVELLEMEQEMVEGSWSQGTRNKVITKLNVNFKGQQLESGLIPELHVSGKVTDIIER